jgi:hypothetical protein
LKGVYALLDKKMYLNSKVFTPGQPVNASNQQSFRINYLSEFVTQQLLQNENIHYSIEEIISTINCTQQQQENKMNLILKDQQHQKDQSNYYIQKVELQSKTTDVVLHTLESLKNQQIEMNECIQKEQLLNQAILDQLNFQDQQLRQTNSQLNNYVNLSTQLNEQLIQQEKILKEMEQKLQLQDVYHSTVMSKLDTQDAMNEKIIRQIDQLKAIVYERVNSIIEKIELSYEATTLYINDLFNKNGFMKPFLLSSKTKEKNSLEESEIEEKVN